MVSNPEPVIWHPLVFDEGQLWFKNPRRYSRTFRLNEPSIPLSDIVKLPRELFTEKKRVVLSYLLARAVWQYYDSDWMIRGWTKEAVHFMYEKRRDESGLFVDEPFLHAEPSIGSDSDDRTAARPCHQFPKILALGIMLIEINLGIKIEDERTAEICVDDKPMVNADAIIADRLSNDRKWLKEHSPYLTDAVRFCMNPSKVAHKHIEEKAQEEREHLYKHVVTPLRTLCEWSFKKQLDVAAINLPEPAKLLHRQSEPPAERRSDTDDLQSRFSRPVHSADIKGQSVDDLGQAFRYVL